MLAAGIIEPIEESEWVSPMVVQAKKTKGEIRICVDLRKLTMLLYMIPSPHHLQMKYWIMQEDRKSTPLQMASQVITRSRSMKKTGIKPPLQQNGAHSSIQ